MNGIDRVMATMVGKPTDRRAVSLTLSLYGARLTGCDLEQYFTDATAYARGQTAVWETFHPDILFGPHALPLYGAAFGSRVTFLPNQPPNMSRPAVASLDDLATIEIPDVRSHPHLCYFREAIQTMAQAHGAEVPIAAITLGPVALPAMILGMECWMETLLFDPDGVERMLSVTIPHFVEWSNACLAAGASFVVLPVVFASSTVVTRRIVEEITIPALRRAFEKVEGPIVLHHGGVRIDRCLDVLLGLPNVAGFVCDSRDDLALVRARIGPDPVLIGQVDGPSLRTQRAEEVTAQCLEVLRDRRNDPHFILGSSAADIDVETPDQNILAFRDAAETFAGVAVS